MTNPIKLRSNPSLTWPLISLIIAMLSIQSGASLAKDLFPLLGVSVTTMLRTGLGAAILGTIWPPKLTLLPKDTRITALAYGASLGLMNLTFYLSLERIPLGLAVTLEFIGPLGLALVHSKKVFDLLWAIMALLGILILVPHSSLNANSLDPLGVFYALVAGGLWASYIIFGKRIGSKIQGGRAASLGMSGAALIVLPFGLWNSHSLIEHWFLIPKAFLIALFSSAIPYALEMNALRTLSTKTFGILMALEPVIACLIGWLLLGESLSMEQWCAVGLITFAAQGSLWSQALKK